MYGTTVPALHILTNDVILADPGFITTAKSVMESCRTRVAIHLRGTETSPRRLLELALELRVIAEMTGSWALVNDRVDIALVSGVTGAQLTSRSLLVADARRIAPGMILGASVHATADAWLTAQNGASFLVAGPGDGGSPAGDGAQFVEDVVAAAEGCPVVAVGGITPDRAHRMAQAGATGVAVMRGIWLDDAVGATRRYLAAYDEGYRR
ncbi:MAG TPA: thiamine phosphate synthase [Gemmatimonadaceae bacterium]|nr:thiamine phosphate synthase [Gemmatimonadaceae bacterium]